MLQQLPNGGIQVSARCPMDKCPHRFLVRWHPPQDKKHVILPPFKSLNKVLNKNLHDHIGEHLAKP